ncbi:unnamed protein product [Anisakis simplex]|uniref:Uncharacterized protein n=1 Tax=Anisakis simplex TaxID=6269 RepID=A0A0M3JFT0_ANISI|nr:unnamed protein product [Anisakis simplex]
MNAVKCGGGGGGHVSDRRSGVVLIGAVVSVLAERVARRGFGSGQGQYTAMMLDEFLQLNGLLTHWVVSARWTQ